MSNDSAKITIKVSRDFKREIKMYLNQYGYDHLQDGYLELLQHGIETMKKINQKGGDIIA